MSYNFSIRDVMEFAAGKVGIDGWKAYYWQRAMNGSLVRGCVPSGVYQRGPRKGRPKFSKPVPQTYQLVVVSDSEMEAAMAQKMETRR